jgi:hypothetical protein
MEFDQGNAKEGRSTSFAIDLWIKTYQNALKFQIGPKCEIRAIIFMIFKFRQEKMWMATNSTRG